MEPKRGITEFQSEEEFHNAMKKGFEEFTSAVASKKEWYAITAYVDVGDSLVVFRMGYPERVRQTDNLVLSSLGAHKPAFLHKAGVYALVFSLGMLAASLWM